tara:strand:- start:12644 stop:13945 length:1302 start_codon:yes stop_codon:yes gene_type:complete
MALTEITVDYDAAAAPAAAADLEVYDGVTLIANGETTPIDFGTLPAGSANPSYTFTVNNVGDATATILNVVVPDSYTIITDLPSSIASSGTADLVVELETSIVGVWAGNITIVWNTEGEEGGFDCAFTEGFEAAMCYNWAVTGEIEALPTLPHPGIFNPFRVSLVYSGGGNNIFPNKSLGGLPSAFPVQSGLNNLFDDSFPGEFEGEDDYRCFYVFNDNEDSAFENAIIWVESQIEGGANIQLGVRNSTEKQKIVIEAIEVTGGSLTMDVGGCEFTFAYDADIDVWASNLQSAINTTCSLDGVTVAGSTFDAGATELFIFDVSFGGDGDNRAYDLIEFVSSTLTGNGILEPAVQRTTAGGPINEVAPAIGSETTPPAGISFSLPNRDDPTTVGTLNPNEGFPIWVKRSTAVDAEKTMPDGFVFKIRGKGILNS